MRINQKFSSKDWPALDPSEISEAGSYLIIT